MGLLPTTGFTLPFISFGANSLIVCSHRGGGPAPHRVPRGAAAAQPRGQRVAARSAANVTKTRNEWRWVIAGGGTGGHVTPALALAERIEARGDAVLFIGSERGLETRLVPEAGIELVALPAQQIMGRSLARRLASVPAILRACAAAWKRLGAFRRRHRDLGRRLRVGPRGRRGLAAPHPRGARGAQRRAGSGQPRRGPHRPARVRPVRRRRPGLRPNHRRASAFARPASRCADGSIETFGENPAAARAGSALPPARLRRQPGRPADQRSHDRGACDPWTRADLTIFHQTGAADRERVADAYAEAGIEASVVDFEPDMPSRYRWADLALCRSGALTVAELAMAALPALFVPYPHAADDHQAANARALAEAGAARVLDSRSLTGDRLAAALRDLFAAPGALQSMSAAAATLARPDAAEQIIEDCAALLAASVRR